MEQPSYYTKKGKKRKLKPVEDWLWSMTYSSLVHVRMKTRIYIQDLGKYGGKSKSSPRLNVKGEIYVTPISEEHRSVIIRILPIDMVTSHIFHLYGLRHKEMCNAPYFGLR
jgi:hypothetical protein